MDRDTAISLAQKAGILPEWITIVPSLSDSLERFAALCEARGYEKGVAAFHEAVKIEREKYAYRDGHHAGWANATKEIRKLLADIKEWDVSTYLTLPLELRQRIQNAIGD